MQCRYITQRRDERQLTKPKQNAEHVLFPMTPTDMKGILEGGGVVEYIIIINGRSSESTIMVSLPETQVRLQHPLGHFCNKIFVLFTLNLTP